MYILTDDEHRVVSFGPEEYPNAIFVAEDNFPEDWEFLFTEGRLGYFDGIFFYAPREEDKIWNGEEYVYP